LCRQEKKRLENAPKAQSSVQGPRARQKEDGGENDELNAKKKRWTLSSND